MPILLLAQIVALGRNIQRITTAITRLRSEFNESLHKRNVSGV